MNKTVKIITISAAAATLFGCKPGPIYIGHHPTAETAAGGKVTYVDYNVDKHRHVGIPASATGTDRISTKISAAYAQDSLLSQYHINVSTDHHGLVKLSGQVANNDMRAYAIKVARNTKSVMGVDAQNLTVISQ